MRLRRSSHGLIFGFTAFALRHQIDRVTVRRDAEGEYCLSGPVRDREITRLDDVHADEEFDVPKLMTGSVT